jgi:exodeoxyribonuclease VII small subunit
MSKETPPEAAGDPGFEERLEALEAVVRELEGEDLTLEASLERYRQGVEHLRACRAMLDDAEARLAELVGEGSGGEPLERPLRVGDEGLEPFDDDEA